jgi:hypothetical protein
MPPLPAEAKSITHAVLSQFASGEVALLDAIWDDLEGAESIDDAFSATVLHPEAGSGGVGEIQLVSAIVIPVVVSLLSAQAKTAVDAIVKALKARRDRSRTRAIDDETVQVMAEAIAKAIDKATARRDGG